MKPIQEVLVLHHSHTDIGYTHPQPVLWELENRYIDLAIQLCERSESWLEPSRMRWTCEVTAPVMRWLDQAPERQVERFRRLVRAGQIGFGAMYLNVTPLYSAEQLVRSLYPIKLLREEFGAKVSVAINHDVNGLPWPLTQFLLDAGVEAVFMGINIHSGGAPMPRPRGFWWEGSDTRRILAFNAEHYQNFDRRMNTGEGTIEAMAEGMEKYLQQLEEQDYPYDFLYMSATHPRFADNNSPNPRLLELVKQWNDEGREPLIRFATPEMVAERLRAQPSETLARYRGDWTDYWNFGCASSAHETKLYRIASNRLAAADLLQGKLLDTDSRTADRSRQAYEHLQFYGEHTWGADRSVSHPHFDGVTAQWNHKSEHAYKTWTLSTMLLRDAMDGFNWEAKFGDPVKGILFFNPAPVERKVFAQIPKSWREGTWTHSAMGVHRLDVDREDLHAENSETVGPIELPANGYRIVPIAKLQPAVEVEGLVSGENFIESPFHRLEFDPNTGKVLSLLDKGSHRQLLNPDGPWSFFELVRESVDEEKHTPDPTWRGRESFFDYGWGPLWNDGSGWKPDWPAKRSGPNRLTGHVIIQGPDRLTLVRSWEMEGLREVFQKIDLSAHRNAIGLSTTFYMEVVADPEAYYLVFPTSFDASWRAHFDTAGLPTELDAEQIPGCCRDWVTVDRWAALHDDSHGVHLSCLDAPLVQIGDFNFAKHQAEVPRKENPLLLAWLTNNYWNTNFKASQPGHLEFRYELRTFDRFDPFQAALWGLESTLPVASHPITKGDGETSGSLVHLEGEGVVLLQYRKSQTRDGFILRLLNTRAEKAMSKIVIPTDPLSRAFRTNALEEELAQLTLGNPKNQLEIELEARSIADLKLLK